MKEAKLNSQNLTTQAPEGYPKDGDKFMSTDSQAEAQGGGFPQKTAEAETKTRKPHVDVDHSLSPEEQEKMTRIAEALGQLSPDSNFQTYAKQQAEATPEQESVRQRRGETGGIKTYNQLPTQNGGAIDRTGITSEYLLGALNVIEDAAKISPSGKPSEAILVKILEQVSMMQEEGTPEEKGKFSKEKDLARVRIIGKTREIMAENNQEMRANYRAQGLYGERKLTAAEKSQIENARKPEDVERLFNRMFDRVDSRPRAEFSAAFGSIGTFEHDEFAKTLNEAIAENKKIGSEYALDDAGRPTKVTGTERADELNKIRQQFENEYTARSIIHNAYYGVLAGMDTEKVADFIDGFASGFADLAFKKSGVTQAMHFYEQAILITRESAGGYLKPTEVVGEMKTNSEGKVNELAKKLLNEANAKGLLVVDENGNPKKDGEGNLMHLEPWEIDRASAFARGMSIVTGITIERAASSLLPPGSEAYSDQYAQRIIAELAPFRHGFKFYAGSEFSRVLAYSMHRGRGPWSTKDIEDYAELDFGKKIDVLNALVPDGKERLYSVLNPLEIGGIFTRTGWRIGGGGATMINDMVKGMSKDKIDEAWIGTGVQLERKRGALVNEKAKEHAAAEEAVKIQLENVGNRTPLRILLNIRSAQEKIIDGYIDGTTINGEKIDIKQLKTPKPDKTEEGIRVDKLAKLRINQIELLQSSFEELALLQETANLAKHDLDEAFMKENRVSDATLDLVKRIRGVWEGGERDNFFKTLRDNEWKTPFTFGTDDIPYDQYSFETSGPRSAARRWGDMKSAAAGSKALNELVSEGIEHFSNQEQVVEAMAKVYKGIKGYNEDDARKFTVRLAEGIMKFYGKDYKARLPLGMGTLMGLVTGKASYAQIVYGKGAMAWDELQLNEFTRLLRSHGMITVEQQHELQNRAGGGKKEVVWGYTRTVLPLIMMALAYYMYTQVVEEKK